jgi:hypothetical protein
MTKGSAVLPARVVAEQGPFVTTQGDEKHLLFSNYSPVVAPPSPFVISTGAKRSGEISVRMLFLGNVFLAERRWATHAIGSPQFFDRVPPKS